MVTVLGAASLKQPASLAPNSTKALQSASVEQPPLNIGQLELGHRCYRQVSLYLLLTQCIVVVMALCMERWDNKCTHHIAWLCAT